MLTHPLLKSYAAVPSHTHEHAFAPPHTAAKPALAPANPASAAPAAAAHSPPLLLLPCRTASAGGGRAGEDQYRGEGLALPSLDAFLDASVGGRAPLGREDAAFVLGKIAPTVRATIQWGGASLERGVRANVDHRFPLVHHPILTPPSAPRASPPGPLQFRSQSHPLPLTCPLRSSPF
jgi:hypothetical protein